MNPRITSPHDAALNTLCDGLRKLEQDGSHAWPAPQLDLCASYGVFEWFIDPRWGGQGWSAPDLLAGYVALASASLNTAFVITQRSGACRRIALSDNSLAKDAWLPGLADGTHFATVGISHLTTSRRHLGNAVLQARRVDGGHVLNGFAPWITGGAFADAIVVGAALENGQQILLALSPSQATGVSFGPHAELVALTASHTGQVHFKETFIGNAHLLAGPAPNAMASKTGGGAGGLQTSALALGLAKSALDALGAHTVKRPQLGDAASALRRTWDALVTDMMGLASGAPTSKTPAELRSDANRLALDATQANLSATKGAGFQAHHPAGRWCQQALFFLVWSCPEPIMLADLAKASSL